MEDFDASTPNEQVYTGSGEFIGFTFGVASGSTLPSKLLFYDGTSSSGTLLLTLNSGKTSTNSQITPVVCNFPGNTSIKFSTGLHFAFDNSASYITPSTVTVFFSA